MFYSVSHACFLCFSPKEESCQMKSITFPTFLFFSSNFESWLIHKGLSYSLGYGDVSSINYCQLEESISQRLVSLRVQTKAAAEFLAKVPQRPCKYKAI